jgi:hypothetical protein
VGAPGQIDKLSCFVVLENNTNLPLSSSGCLANNGGAIDTTDFPTLRLTNPLRDTLVAVAPNSVQLSATLQRGTADSVVFFRDSFVRLGKAISVGSGSFVMSWIPPTSDGRYYIAATAYKSSGTGQIKAKTIPVLFEINDGNAFVNNPEDVISSSRPGRISGNSVMVYPNPASCYFNVVSGKGERIESVELIDLAGKRASIKPSTKSGQYST